MLDFDTTIDLDLRPLVLPIWISVRSSWNEFSVYLRAVGELGRMEDPQEPTEMSV